ncbi:MAG: GLUG motif-containing protein [Ignavibacteria bacterium]|nr:GLUG motif-containing protein [Ignavibacteria bacterium]
MKKILTFLIIIITFSVCEAQTATSPSTGSGTLADPYQIANLNNLYWIAENSSRWASHYIQTADIDASSTSTWFTGEGWIPIGDNTTNFTGSYNGQYYTITGLFINRATTDYIGLFGKTNGTNIASVNLSSVNITGKIGVGGLVGGNYFSTISNCSSFGVISGTDATGGLVGANLSTSTIINSYSGGTVTGTSFSTGGLCGRNDWSSISNSYSTASVIGSIYVGGFVGENNNAATIKNCYATGSVHCTAAPGSVAERLVGGFVGVHFASSTISKSYSTGLVTGSHVDHGGFIGNKSNNAVVTDCFWDTESSQKANSKGGTGKSTSQMKTMSTFTTAGWDFINEIANGTNDYWGLDGSVNNGYPNLRFNRTPPYVQNFDGVAAPELPYGWKIENTNQDERQWTNSTLYPHSSLNSLRYQYINSSPANDWIFSPGIDLVSGTDYEVSFWYRQEGGFGSEKLEVKYGLSQSSASMTSAAVFSKEDITTTTYTKGTGTISVISSGRYYIGWHCFSIANQSDLYIDDILIRVKPTASVTAVIPSNNLDPIDYTGTGTTIQFTGANAAPLDLTVDVITSNPGGTPPGGLTNMASNYWTVTVNSGGVDGTYSISFDVADLAGVTNYETLHLIKRNNASGIWTDYGVANFIAGTKLTWNGFTSFSDFGIGGGNDNPLPVELTSFTASIVGNNVNLIWQTATEVNNYGFEVERAVNLRGLEDENGNQNLGGFETIGFVQGNGNCNSPKEYSFTDKSTTTGKFAYRLKQIDNDGKYSYSDIVEVELNNIPTEFALYQNYPNPFNPSTTIKYALPMDSKVVLEVYNIVGQKVKTLINNENKEAGYHQVNFNANELATGIYIYRLTANNFTSTKKFVLMK